MKDLNKRNKYLHKKVVNPVENDWEEEVYSETTTSKWYEEISKEPVDTPQSEQSEVLSLKGEAEVVLKKEEEIYSKKGSRNGHPDKAWLRTVMSKGTASDKMAAFIVTIQDSPIYNLTALRNLVNSVKVSKKNECLTVMETLTDLFLSDLLRPDCKLRTFDQQPLPLLSEMCSGNVMTRKKFLCRWLFEDKLKTLYSQFISAVDAVGRDTVDVHRERAVTAMYKLLAGNPEQEVVLLKILVNKLGDPNQKVVSKVIYSLTQLLRVHPVMKQVVADEIEKFLFRPNVGARSQYYAICFLSQYLFSSEDAKLAENIIKIYFSFFKANVKKGNIDTRMMGALLMGVNRAYPYAKIEQSELSEHIDTMYKLVHICSFNIALQTLTLLYQIVGHSTDRFYCALYKKLLDPHLAASAHQGMFINLVYKALKKDTNVTRVRVFIKRLLQVSLNGPSPLSCALLYLVSELIFKRPQLLALKTHKQEIFEEDDNDGEENYKDAPLETEENTVYSSPDATEDVKEVKSEEKPKAGWFHCKNSEMKMESRAFDGRARNPAHAGGEYSAYEELTALATHFHPTVALFAKNILDKQPVKYSGDPLQDFTLLRFLERFVFKNPKQLSVDEKGPDPCLAQRRHYQAQGVKAVSVMSNAYIQQEEKTVPVDELFLYRYLQQRKPIIKDKEEEDEDQDSDVESVGSDEFNDMLDNMGVGKMDEDLDFADEVGNKLRNKKNSKNKQNESDSESDEEMSEDGVDEDETDLEDEEMTDLEAEDEGSDAEAIDFGEDVEDFDGEIDLNNLDSEEDFEEDTRFSKSKKVKKTPKGTHSMFAPAEKFAEMLEETGASRFKVGTAHDVSNKDNAAVKQLEWESKRNQWTHHTGNKRKQFGKGPGKSSFNKTKSKKLKK